MVRLINPYFVEGGGAVDQYRFRGVTACGIG
jgi:hypothetical protein